MNLVYEVAWKGVYFWNRLGSNKIPSEYLTSTCGRAVSSGKWTFNISSCNVLIKSSSETLRLDFPSTSFPWTGVVKVWNWKKTEGCWQKCQMRGRESLDGNMNFLPIVLSIVSWKYFFNPLTIYFSFIQLVYNIHNCVLRAAMHICRIFIKQKFLSRR